MADDARTQFFDGLRVSAEHLQHLQDRLREGVLDVRNALGLGHVAWGLRATLNGNAVELVPGVAFARDGVRLALDAPQSLPVPDGPDGTLAVVLRAVHGDKEALRFDGLPTVLTLDTQVELGDAPAPTELGALALATITRAGGGLSIAQDDALFVAFGPHAHTGQHLQDADGRWHFDGDVLAAAGPKGDKGDPGDPGPKGDPGDPGPKGDTGDPGPKGDTGDPGPRGDKGDQGDPGPKGDPGDPGPKGDPGDPGPKGDKGDQGDPGAPGAKGDQGDPGPKGDQGDPGAPGAKGDQGDPGPKGDKGDQGDPGPKGDQGDPGPKGDQGDPGAPGAKGDQGDPGPKGDKGDQGDPGPKGDKGDQGDPGPKGDKGDQGDPGPKGDKGDPGQKGDQGDPGPKGDQGGPGPKGDQGDPGAKGDQGDPGPKGDKGDQGDPGPAGPGLDQDWGVITRINWRHDGSMPADVAANLLQSGLVADISRPLTAAQLEQPPQVFEVWFQPDSTKAGAAPGPPLPMVSIFGRLAATPQQLVWTSLVPASVLLKTLRPGRMLVRIHCSTLQDPGGRQFSSTLMAVLGVKALVLPGGVFESWFFVV